MVTVHTFSVEFSSRLRLFQNDFPEFAAPILAHFSATFAWHFCATSLGDSVVFSLPFSAFLGYYSKRFQYRRGYFWCMFKIRHCLHSHSTFLERGGVIIRFVTIFHVFNILYLTFKKSIWNHFKQILYWNKSRCNFKK